MANAKQLNQSGVLYTDRRDFYLAPNYTAELWKDVTPFLTMLSSKPAKVTRDPDFKLFEHRDSWLEMNLLVNDAAPGAWSGSTPGSTITTTFDTPSGIGDEGIGDHLVGMVVQIVDTTGATEKGIALITGRTGNDLTLKFLGNPYDGSNLPGALADNDIMEIIGTGFPEGSTAPEAYSDDLSVVYNSAQIFRVAVEVTGSLYAQTSLRGYSSELARLRLQKSKVHQILQERTLLFGVRPGGTGMGGGDSFATIMTDSEGKNERFTMGIIPAIYKYGSASGDTQNKFSITMATYAYDNWVDDSEKVFRNLPSSDTKIAFCGGTVLNYFAKIGTNGFMGNSSVAPQIGPAYVGPFGFMVRELMSPHGRILLANAPLLRGRHNNKMVIMDPENVFRVKYRPDRYTTNIKTEDDYDGIKDVFFSDSGLGISMIETHSLWTFS